MVSVIPVEESLDVCVKQTLRLYLISTGSEQRWDWEFSFSQLLQCGFYRLRTENSKATNLPSKEGHTLYFPGIAYSSACMLSRSVLSNSLYFPPGSSVHGIIQARTLEQVAISSFRGSFQPRNRTCISCAPCAGRWNPYQCATWEARL